MKNMISRFTLVLISILIITSFYSCDKDTKEEDPPANTAPTAVFTVQPTSGGTSTIFQFDASGSHDTEDQIAALQFRWDWNGDGTWDTQYSNDPQAQNTYPVEGNYSVKLEVKDTGGLTGLATETITVSGAANNPPNPPGNPDPTDGETDVHITTNLSWSCTDPDGDLLKYDVYFGTTNNPPLVDQDINTTIYDPGTLQENTIYYWKIVAKDIHGDDTPGAVWTFTTLGGSSFTCGDPFTDPRDQQVYPTVLIGNACWMAKNMNIGDMVNGSQGQANNQVIEKFCYGDNTNNCDTYGGLYQWDEMMQYGADKNSQGICPNGWHIPDDVEFMEMEMAVGMPETEVIKSGLRGTDEGTKLKAGGSSGFEGLLGGYHNGGQFLSLDSYGTFFSSDDASNLAWCRYLFNDNSQVLRDKYEKSFAFSVRCVKDAK